MENNISENMNEKKKRAYEIDFYGSTLEECVNSLLKFQKRGVSVFVEFNGHKLYSCDVTMDSAYMEVTGKTKAEFDKAREEHLKKIEEEQAIKEAEAKAKIPSWIEKGEAYIYPERMEKWKQCVEVRAGDLYHGMDLDAALAIMEKLENGATIEEAKELFDNQGHSGSSAGMVRSMLFVFSKRGPEFYENTAWGELTEEEKKQIEYKKKENAALEELHSPKETDESKDPYSELKAMATEVKFTWKYGNTIEDAVKELEEYRAKGESVVIDFNGHKLYSCDVTMDSAYTEVTGKTKAEFDKAREEHLKKIEEEQAIKEAEAKGKIPSWIEKGEAYIYPERMEKWKQCVEVRAGDLYHGMDLDAALAIMEKLENGATIEEAKELFDSQGHSGSSAGMVRSMLFVFSKRGPEFYENTAWGELTEKEKKQIEEKKRENEELAEIHKTDSTQEISPERKQKEQELTDSCARKEQLTAEIDDIEQQLEDLRAKEAELKKSLSEKQTELNSLE